MILMIASDLHGSAYWTKQLLDAFRQEDAEKLLLLGDLLEDDLGGGGFPCVSAQLNTIKDKIIAVRGNCDAEEDQMLLEFPMMADFAELEVNGLRLYATHGHLWNEARPPALEDGMILANGHFHIPACRPHGTWLYVNPGSVSRPRAGSVRGYMLLRDRTFTWKGLNRIAYHDYTVE